MNRKCFGTGWLVVSHSFQQDNDEILLTYVLHCKYVCFCFYKGVCPLRTCTCLLLLVGLCHERRNVFWLTDSNVNMSPLSSAACSCHTAGSVLSGGSPLCSPTSGECTCKPGVGGPRCDSCMMGYWGLREYGCRPCDCTGDCDPYTGDCISGWEPRPVCAIWMSKYKTG